MTEATPRRVQLSRKKGWRMPENTVSVARPGRWGNPFRIGEVKFFVNDDDPADKVFCAAKDNAEAVSLFRWLVKQGDRSGVIRSGLAGKNLACWCRLDQTCHADVLLEIANAQVTHD